MVNEAIATAANHHFNEFHSNAITSTATTTTTLPQTKAIATTTTTTHLNPHQAGDRDLKCRDERSNDDCHNAEASLNWTFFEQVTSVDNQLRANEHESPVANEIRNVDVIAFDDRLMSDSTAIGQQQQHQYAVQPTVDAHSSVEFNKRASFVESFEKQQQQHQQQQHQQQLREPKEPISCKSNGILTHPTTTATATKNHVIDILSQQTQELNQHNHHQHQQQQLQPTDRPTFRFTSPTATFKRKKEQQQRCNNNNLANSNNNNNNCISIPQITKATTPTNTTTIKRSPIQVNCNINSNHNSITAATAATTTIKRSPHYQYEQQQQLQLQLQQCNNENAPTSVTSLINGCGSDGLARVQTIVREEGRTTTTTTTATPAIPASASTVLVAGEQQSVALEGIAAEAARKIALPQRRRLPAISIRDTTAATATATAATTTKEHQLNLATTTQKAKTVDKRKEKKKQKQKGKQEKHGKEGEHKMGATLTQASRTDSRSSSSGKMGAASGMCGATGSAVGIGGHGGGDHGAGVGVGGGVSFIDGMEMHFGLNGWRKKCLYTLLLLLMLLIVTNLVLTLWILKVMEFTTDGMGQLKIIPGGIQLTGQTIIMDMLRASTIRSRHGQPITIESSRNFSINTRDMNGMLENHLFLGHDKLECLAAGFRINDTNGRNLFSVNRNEVTIGAHALRIDGEGGAIFRESIQTPHVRAEPGRELRLESPTRQLEMTAAKDITLQSRAGGIEVQALEDVKLTALDGSLRLESTKILMPNLRTAQPPLPGMVPSRDHLHRVFQLCACSNGKLFLAAPHSICAGDDTTVCR